LKRDRDWTRRQCVEVIKRLQMMEANDCQLLDGSSGCYAIVVDDVNPVDKCRWGGKERRGTMDQDDRGSLVRSGVALRGVDVDVLAVSPNSAPGKRYRLMMNHLV
jgi:hypothetical protein